MENEHRYVEDDEESLEGFILFFCYGRCSMRLRTIEMRHGKRIVDKCDAFSAESLRLICCLFTILCIKV